MSLNIKNKIKKFKTQDYIFEYGVYGKRLLPWNEINAPFGGAFCKLLPGEKSLDHKNDPEDELEMFICMAGSAQIVIDGESERIQFGDVISIPYQSSHYVINDTDQDFIFYSIWWNSELVKGYENRCAQELENA